MNFKKVLTLVIASIVIPSYTYSSPSNDDMFKNKNELTTAISESQLANFNIQDYIHNWLFNDGIMPNGSNITAQDVRTFVNSKNPSELKNLLTNEKLYGNKDSIINGNKVLEIIKSMDEKYIQDVILQLIPNDETSIINIDGLKNIISNINESKLKDNLVQIIANSQVNSIVKALTPQAVKNVLIELLSLPENDYNETNITNIIFKAMQNGSKKPIFNNNPVNSMPVINEHLFNKYDANFNKIFDVLKNNNEITSKELIEIINKPLSEFYPKGIDQSDVNTNKDLKKACDLIANITKIDLLFKKNKDLISSILNKNDEVRDIQLLPGLTIDEVHSIVDNTSIENIGELLKMHNWYKQPNMTQFSLYAYTLALVYNSISLDNISEDLQKYYSSLQKISKELVQTMYTDQLAVELNNLYNNKEMFGKSSGNNKIIPNYHYFSPQAKEVIQSNIPSNIINSIEYSNVLKLLNKLSINVALGQKDIKTLMAYKIFQELNNIDKKELSKIPNINNLILLPYLKLNKSNNELFSAQNRNKASTLLRKLSIITTDTKTNKPKNSLGFKYNVDIVKIVACHAIMGKIEVKNDAIIINNKPLAIDSNKTKNISNIMELLIYLSEILDNNTDYYKSLKQNNNNGKISSLEELRKNKNLENEIKETIKSFIINEMQVKAPNEQVQDIPNTAQPNEEENKPVSPDNETPEENNDENLQDKNNANDTPGNNEDKPESLIPATPVQNAPVVTNTINPQGPIVPQTTVNPQLQTNNLNLNQIPNTLNQPIVPNNINPLLPNQANVQPVTATFAKPITPSNAGAAPSMFNNNPLFPKLSLNNNTTNNNVLKQFKLPNFLNNAPSKIKDTITTMNPNLTLSPIGTLNNPITITNPANFTFGN